nr:CDGSH iron-sulfur domain-containing protein [Gemmatimonadota bacterium]NIR79889.1 CDGSH iron-sulfur domain-containing protein [Gemmatimonadota bacterium]NIT88608.1 CDGSH iron-sulfur domain-containing protein [Gemmatimonadota bacterium]NIU32423.1 CDGSH iron-sulfur domain-containing protein [Gemmatimonadota bacterium]NIV62788.1 CDGSH iron-sulfur domain-containing protein [Gemmatimonadota bacterium]
VEGPITLQDDEGNEYEVREGKATWLCRCGRSSNKPLCDGTHNRIEFVAEERAGAA